MNTEIESKLLALLCEMILKQDNWARCVEGRDLSERIRALDITDQGAIECLRNPVTHDVELTRPSADLLVNTIRVGPALFLEYCEENVPNYDRVRRRILSAIRDGIYSHRGIAEAAQVKEAIVAAFLEHPDHRAYFRVRAHHGAIYIKEVLAEGERFLAEELAE